MSEDQKIIERIQKLLSLANSSNEHEAKLAAERASELLVKHNISMQSVTDHQRIYVDKDAVRISRMMDYHYEIVSILTRHFFVRVIHRRVKYHHTDLILVGTKVNVESAGYVCSFLLRAYPKLWDAFRKSGQVYRPHRKSYFAGLTMGLSENLEKMRFRVEEQTGLVLVKDQGLDTHIQERVDGSLKQKKINDYDPGSVRAGVKDGMDLQIRKPITATAKNSETSLEHKEQS